MTNWILDSGATCHMYNNKDLFTSLHTLQTPLNITVGDGHNLQVVRRGDVALIMKLPNGKTESCTLHNVLSVPSIAYNLLSVTSASRGK